MSPTVLIFSSFVTVVRNYFRGREFAAGFDRACELNEYTNVGVPATMVEFQLVSSRKRVSALVVAQALLRGRPTKLHA